MAEAADVLYRFVDDIPEVAKQRLMIRESAERILEDRRQQQTLTPELLPLPVDALSTADKVWQAEREYGEDSPERQEKYNGLLQDSTLLVAEWNRKLAAEEFPKLRHRFDAETQGYFSHGLLIQQITENGIVPMPNNPEDEARRVNEHIEEHTPQILKKLGQLAGNEVIITISECTDKALDDYNDDFANGRAHRGYGGYVPEISKLMVRAHSFDQDSEDRFEKQVGLPGEYLPHDVIVGALQQLGLEAQGMDKTQLHGEQIVTNQSLETFISHLDQAASEHWNVPIFMGSPVPADHPKDYEAFRAEAYERQSGLQDMAAKTANYVLDLASDVDIDRTSAPAKVEKFVKLLLLDAGKTNPAVAATAFNKQTADDLQRVAVLERQGRYDEALLLMEQVEAAAPGGGYCGAGSCGLERVNMAGEELDELKQSIGWKPGDTLTKDTERKCFSCKKTGNIYYAYRSTGKPKKLCTGCGAKE